MLYGYMLKSQITVIMKYLMNYRESFQQFSPTVRQTRVWFPSTRTYGGFSTWHSEIEELLMYQFAKMQIEWFEIGVLIKIWGKKRTERTSVHISSNVPQLQSNIWTNIVHVCLKVSVLCDNTILFRICAASNHLLHCGCEKVVVWSTFLVPRWE